MRAVLPSLTPISNGQRKGTDLAAIIRGVMQGGHESAVLLVVASGLVVGVDGGVREEACKTNTRKRSEHNNTPVRKTL